MDVKIGVTWTVHPLTGENVKVTHATLRLPRAWWQYRVVNGGLSGDTLHIWRKSTGTHVTGYSGIVFTGFVACREYEVPDNIRDNLITEMMSARLSGQV